MIGRENVKNQRRVSSKQEIHVCGFLHSFHLVYRSDEISRRHRSEGEKEVGDPLRRREGVSLVSGPKCMNNLHPWQITSGGLGFMRRLTRSVRL